MSKEDVDLVIRDAELGDAAPLAVLMCELGYVTSEAEMARRLQTILPNGQVKTFVALVGDRLCGMIGTAAQPSHEHNDLSGRIVALVVLKSMRRRGIARRLIDKAEQDFAERKITRISLTTRVTREDAHQFYEELGYARTGLRYAKTLND